MLAKKNWYEVDDGGLSSKEVFEMWLEEYGGFDPEYDIWNAIKIKNIQDDGIKKLAFKFRQEGYTERDIEKLTTELVEMVKCKDPDRLRLVKQKFKFHLTNTKKDDYSFSYKDALWAKSKDKEAKKAALEERKEDHQVVVATLKKENPLDRIARLSKGG